MLMVKEREENNVHMSPGRAELCVLSTEMIWFAPCLTFSPSPLCVCQGEKTISTFLEIAPSVTWQQPGLGAWEWQQPGSPHQ